MVWKTQRGNQSPTKVGKGEGLSHGQAATETAECGGGDERKGVSEHQKKYY